MRSALILCHFYLCTIALTAQSFSDDFETYASGQSIAAASSVWETPSGPNGGMDDLSVSSLNAHSGSNSLHINTASAQPGGNGNLLLPMPQTLTSGTLTLEWWMYMNNSGGLESGIIDFLQGNNAVSGQIKFSPLYTWDQNFSMFFIDGEFIRFACAIPLQEWFKMRVVGSIHADRWEVFINDESHGFFNAAPQEIAKLSFKVYSGNSYFIDDVSYQFDPHSTEDLDVVVTAIESAEFLNQQTQPYFWNRDRIAELASKSFAPLVRIRNTGNQLIESFDFALQAENYLYTEHF